MSTFSDRLREFREQMGDGSIRGSVEVNQVYAHYQHEHPEFKHPQGGKAFFLRDPLFQGSDEMMERLAARAITQDGPQVREGMADNMEQLSTKTYFESPVEFGDLRDSGHPMVTQDGAAVYDRAPRAPRLSEEQLKQKGKLRDLMRRNRK